MGPPRRHRVTDSPRQEILTSRPLTSTATTRRVSDASADHPQQSRRWPQTHEQAQQGSATWTRTRSCPTHKIMSSYSCCFKRSFGYLVMQHKVTDTSGHSWEHSGARHTLPVLVCTSTERRTCTHFVCMHKQHTNMPTTRGAAHTHIWVHSCACSLGQRPLHFVD